MRSFSVCVMPAAQRTHSQDAPRCRNDLAHACANTSMMIDARSAVMVQARHVFSGLRNLSKSYCLVARQSVQWSPRCLFRHDDAARDRGVVRPFGVTSARISTRSGRRGHKPQRIPAQVVNDF